MISKAVYDYLEPHLPYQIVYPLSMLVFLVEKFVMPKVYEVYSQASLDPKTLLPFVISAIALYLSLVSIYHAFKTAFKMIWFMIKWSIVIVLAWFLLGLVNNLKSGSNPFHFNSNTFQNYQNSPNPWWKPGSWSAANRANQIPFEPLQILLGQRFLSFFDPSQIFEPMFNHFQSQSKPGSFRQPDTFSTAHPSSKTKGQTYQQNPRSTKPNQNSDNASPFEFLQRFWTETVQKPVQSAMKEAHERSQTSSQSGSSTRTR